MRILVFPYTHMLSHLSRPLLVARELAERGCEVIFAGEGEKSRFIERAGFPPVLPLYEPDPRLLLENIRKGRVKFATDEEIEAMIEADLAVFADVAPDLVLSDFRISAPISTQLSGLRHVAIVNASSTEYRSLPYAPLFGWIPKGFRDRYTGLDSRLDSLNLGLEMFIFDNLMSIFKKLSARHRLRKRITATNCLTGVDTTLLADVPDYFPTHDLPDDYHYVGPLTWKSDLPPPSWWPPKRSNGPLVYVTMGTTGIEELFALMLDLFCSQANITAIVTTGAQTSNMEAIDGHVYVEPFIDGDLVMEASDLVICHGGNGTIYQAIQHGTPVIGIPTLADQQFNMRMVERLEIGRSISWRALKDDPSALIRLIGTTIGNQAIRDNVSKLRSVVSRYEAPKTAASLIPKLGDL